VGHVESIQSIEKDSSGTLKPGEAILGGGNGAEGEKNGETLPDQTERGRTERHNNQRPCAEQRRAGHVNLTLQNRLIDNAGMEMVTCEKNCSTAHLRVKELAPLEGTC